MTATAHWLDARRPLQIAIALMALLPLGAGLAGAIGGPTLLDEAARHRGLDSHARYLSGLLVGIGLAYWATIPDIERRGSIFRVLTMIVLVGGLSRLLGAAITGHATINALWPLAPELVAVPLVYLWQQRVARAAGHPG